MSFDFAFHFFFSLLLSWLCCSCVYHAYKKEVIKRNETKEQKKCENDGKHIQENKKKRITNAKIEK
jgi:hypothetical protein